MVHLRRSEITVSPPTASERELLVTSLERQRQLVLWKVSGLPDGVMRRKMLVSGTSVLGLLKHLGSVEYGWLCRTFERPTEPLPDIAGDPEADMRVGDDEIAEELVAFYRRAIAAADTSIASLTLDDVGTSWKGTTVSLRWVIVHMIEETCRHLGHLDVMRELIDGQIGDTPEFAAHIAADGTRLDTHSGAGNDG